MSAVTMAARRVAGAAVFAAFLILGGAQAAEPTSSLTIRLTAEPPNSLTTAACPVCSFGELQLWTAAANNQLGVRVRDSIGPYAGYWPAERYYAYDNWFPQSVVKRTLCGILDHFNFYDG